MRHIIKELETLKIVEEVPNGEPGRQHHTAGPA